MGQSSVSLETVAKSPVKGGIKLLTRPGKNDKVSGELNVEVWLSDVPVVPCAVRPCYLLRMTRGFVELCCSPARVTLRRTLFSLCGRDGLTRSSTRCTPYCRRCVGFLFAGRIINCTQLIDPTIFEARFRNFKARLGHCTGSEGFNIAKCTARA